MRLSNLEINGFVFNANFDSGNLAKIELIRRSGEYFLDKNTSINVQQANSTPASSSTGTTSSSSAASINVTPTTATSAAQNNDSSTSQSISLPSPKEKQVDIEFNLWTRPDCAGTPFENSNRTWFYFSVRGGEKNQLVKFNVLNLNKQAKLFSQGMHPVVKHGNNGKWERIKNKPTFYLTDENFVLSFLHTTHENVEDNLTFYAFTYPYTYKEQQDAIDGYERKHGRANEELEIIAREMSGPKKDKLVIKMNEKMNFKGGGDGGGQKNELAEHLMGDTLDELEAAESFEFVKDAKGAFKILERSCEKELLDVLTEDANDELRFKEYLKTKESLKLKPSTSNNVIDENTSESMQQITNLVNNVKIELPSTASILESASQVVDTVRAFQIQDIRERIDEIKDEIYFYRELLISSYEDRRIELLTITSFQGIEDRREERIKNLFPDHSTPRCHTFKDKKIIFISSRVHPGETPASFVLNGFINLLLDRKNHSANALRKLYVFKIVPFLNPDGVANGLYRSDTLGHNLNRVYLNPRLDTQPSIYAARKLIRFYHFGYDKPDEYNEIGELITDSGSNVENSFIVLSGTCTGDDEENQEALDDATKQQKVAEDLMIFENEAKADKEISVEGNREECKFFTLPKIDKELQLPKSNAKKKDLKYNTNSNSLNGIIKRSNTSLNIFDQTASHVLKMFSAKNWTDTFFNRIFQKRNSLQEQIINVEDIKQNLNDSYSSRTIIELPQLPSAQPSQMTPNEPVAIKIIAKIDNYLTQNSRSLPPLQSDNSEIFTDDTDVQDDFKKSPEKEVAEKNARNSAEDERSIKSIQRKPLQKSFSKSENGKTANRTKIAKLKESSRSNTTTTTTKDKKLSISKGNDAMKSRQNTLTNALNAHGNRVTHHHHYKHQISHYNADKQQKLMQQQYFSQQHHQSLNISLDFLTHTDVNGEKCITEEKSNLFLYLDLHGHASKKGVFMYGNHLPNTHEAVECMLLPRLMSMNCHHFHFDACNFSERNMYLRGKRDGLSKEGSGRVAIYKSTGLIKSYTLESNYNMAKCVNVLPPKGKEQSCKVLNLIPPKFSPQIFEEVGRALGPSILDLTNSNPSSRLINSEFRTLQGLRNALKNEISRGMSKARVNKFTKAKNNRNSVTLPSSTAQDVSKENKVYPNHPNHQHHPNQWENIPSSSASCSSHHPNTNQMQPDKLKHHRQQQNLKNSSLNKSETKAAAGQQQQPGHSRLLNQGQKLKLGHSNFSKKDVLSSKKKKVLCETTSVVTHCVTTTTSTTSNVQSTKLLKDHHHQVPRKKIKVSQSSLTGASVTTATQNPLSSFLQDQSMDSQSQQLPSYYLNTDLDLFVGTSNVSTSDIYVDDSIPCCSKSIINYHHQKSPSSLSNSSCSSQSNLVVGATQTTQLKITNFLPVKKHPKVRKTKFGKEGKTCTKIGIKKQSKKLMGKVSNNTNNASIIESDSTTADILLHENLIDDAPATIQSMASNTLNTTGSKLLKKKKRTLKTENTNLKIKKSRCKRLLH